MRPHITPIRGTQLNLLDEISNMAKSDWVASGALCRHLAISPKHLWRLRDEGLLKQGIHWRNIARPQAARPTYRWHLKRCESALETKPENR